MFVLNSTHRLRLNSGLVITIPQGTELQPTAQKLLWQKQADGRKTAIYYIKNPMEIAGNANNWWQVSGWSVPSFKVSRIKRTALESWKAGRIDNWFKV